MDVGTQTHDWQGREGRSYRFRVYEASVDWDKVPEVGGVYVFACRENQSGGWVPLYIGETEDFADRMPDHEKWSTLVEEGNFTRSDVYIHVLDIQGKSQRKYIQDELIQEYYPRWNSKIFNSNRNSRV